VMFSGYISRLLTSINYEPSHYAILSSDGDRLCGLVVGVSSYRSRGPGFDSRPYQIFSENLNSRGSGTGSTQPRESN
jgi:hypothetical protein